MLFVIFVGLIVLGIVICCFADVLYETGVVASAIGVIATLISVIILLCNYAGVDGYVAQMNTRYDTLTYQYENDIYDNDNDLGKRELMEDIQSWNEDLAWHKENQDDLWIGIYIPNIYDQFEFIELK